MKKGFTLVELLVAIVIIALLGALGVVSFSSIFKIGNTKYYDDLESSMLLAGNDYFLDHREELPSEYHVSDVTLNELVSSKYIEPLKKSNGEACTDGKVYVYKENNKYKYEACIFCDTDHVSKGKYCNGVEIQEILVSAKKSVSNTVYNVLSNYSDIDASDEDIKIIVSMKNIDVIISKFEVVNVNTGDSLSCTKTGNSTCEVDISVSGTYKISAKMDDDVVATKYINAKIIKQNSIEIDKNNLKRYCANVKYNGNTQIITIPSHEGLVFTGNEHTNAGNYNVVAHIDAPNYIWSDGSADNKEFECSIGIVTCNPPTNVSINPNGEVTWVNSDNCTDATYALKVENGEYSTSSSGVNKKDDIIASSGTRNVFVKTIAPNENYEDSLDASGATTVYTVTLTKGNGILTVSGAGRYITGSTVTLGATVNTNYTWKNWALADGTSISTENAYQNTITSDWSYKANTKTYTKITYPCTKGKYKAGKPQNVSSSNCTPIGYKEADRNNTNRYVTCTPTSDTDINTGHTVYYTIKVEWTRNGCDKYSETGITLTGQSSCTPSQDKNYQYVCIEE